MKYLSALFLGFVMVFGWCLIGIIFYQATLIKITSLLLLYTPRIFAVMLLVGIPIAVWFAASLSLLTNKPLFAESIVHFLITSLLGGLIISGIVSLFIGAFSFILFLTSSFFLADVYGCYWLYYLLNRKTLS